MTYSFLAACWLVTVPSLFVPRLYDVFGGLAPRREPWQLVTAVLEHGWPGFPGSVHLLLNTFLILECGRPCERLLGPGRFASVCGLSVLATAVAQVAAGGVNGSSLVIWAWGPPLVLALRWARDRGIEASATAYARIRAVLLLMYVGITLVMAALPYLAGWRGNPLVALLRANLFHLVATAVGIACALALRRHAARRLATLARPLSRSGSP